MEPGETAADTAKRECLEESGYEVEIIAERNIGYCDVCAARIVRKVSDGEMKSELFTEIPNELAFDVQEYEEVIPWAKSKFID